MLSSPYSNERDAPDGAPCDFMRRAPDDVAISAATELLGVATEGAKGARLIEESIDAVKSRLN